MLKLFKYGFTLAALFCSFLVLAPVGHSQSTRGTVAGTVQDKSGGAITGGTITLTSPDTGVTSSTVTNSSGIYRFESVPVGDYNLSVSANGFGKQQVPVSVSVGAPVAQERS